VKRGITSQLHVHFKHMAETLNKNATLLAFLSSHMSFICRLKKLSIYLLQTITKHSADVHVMPLFNLHSVGWLGCRKAKDMHVPGSHALMIYLIRV
jgi:hypothetical protein